MASKTKLFRIYMRRPNPGTTTLPYIECSGVSLQVSQRGDLLVLENKPRCDNLEQCSFAFATGTWSRVETIGGEP